MTRSVLVEACVESMDEVLAAVRGGADRLELCASMDVGGTTPSTETIAAVKAAVHVPVSVMVRPRGGSFVHTASEVDQMRRDIDLVKAAGADMLVLGLLMENGCIDADKTRELVARAGETPVTFHKAFDEIGDQLSALDALIDAGISRVLTSGGAPMAVSAVDRLAALVERGGNRIVVMAGGRVRADNVHDVVARGRVREVHARCLSDAARIGDIVTALSTPA